MRRFVVGIVACLMAMSLDGVVGGAEIITVRSGQVNGQPGNIAQFDDIVTWGAISGSLPLSNVPFTATDFNTAANWPAMVAEPYLYGWVFPLPADPLARYINFDVWFDSHPDFQYWRSSVGTTLYRVPFTVTTTNIGAASLSVYWAADDTLGDPSGPNTTGAYLRDGNGNVTPLPAVSGGSLFSQSQALNLNVTSAITTGPNELFFYQRDTHGVTSGTIFSATFVIDVPEPTGAAAMLMVALAAVITGRRRVGE